LAVLEKLTRYNISSVSASGPSSDTVVSAGGTANVDLSISADVNVSTPLGIESVSGLPAGVAIAGWTFPDNSTLRLILLNPTASDVTVTAGSVSATVIVLSF